MEVEVLKKAGFRMPLYTPVYCIEILLAALNFLKIHFESGKTTENREKLYETSMLLLDLAYMQVCKNFLPNSSISLILQFLNIFCLKFYF